MSRRNSYTPGQGFLNDSTNTTHQRSLTQPKLFGMHKAAIVTPRTSSSSSSSTSRSRAATQPSLACAFERQHAAFSASASTSAATRPAVSTLKLSQRRDKARRRASSDSEERDDEDDATRTRQPSSGQRHRDGGTQHQRQQSSSSESSSGSRSTPRIKQEQQSVSLGSILGVSRSGNSLGRCIINPPQLRRGPTIAFDDNSEDDGASGDDDEMRGESQRRKRNRILHGGRGELDLVPLNDFDGFGRDRGSSVSSAARRASSSSSRDVKPSQIGVKRALALTTSSSGGRRAEIDHDLRGLCLGETRSQPRKYRSMGDENAPSEDSPLSANARRLSQLSRGGRFERRSTSASPSEPDTEPDEPFAPLASTHRPLESQERSFADSSQSDAGEYLQQQLVGNGQGSPDVLVGDSESDEEGRLDRLARQTGRGGADDSGFAEMLDEGDGFKDGPILPSSQRADHALPLARSESSILMPPPPVPIRARSFPSPPTVTSKELVLETQIQQVVSPYHTSKPTSPIRFNSIYDVETQWLDQAAIRPHGTRAPPVSTWHSLESAWAGARPLTPPPPASPRQAKLFEFFPLPRAGSVEDADEEMVIADSQPNSIPLVQMRAFQSAFETTREMGRRSPPLEVVEEEEVIEEVEDVAEEEEEVPSSDQEDLPWSPLGSPNKIRFPTLLVEPTGIPEDASQKQQEMDVDDDDDNDDDLPLPSLPSSLDHLSLPPSSQRPSSASGAAEETQWESYWTLEARQPSPFQDLIDDAESL